MLDGIRRWFRRRALNLRKWEIQLQHNENVTETLWLLFSEVTRLEDRIKELESDD